MKKILSEFTRVATEDPERWLAFVGEYNRPLKEGSTLTSPTARR